MNEEERITKEAEEIKEDAAEGKDFPGTEEKPEEVSLGLVASDTEDYDVDASVPEEPEAAPERPAGRRRAANGRAASFAAGAVSCLVIVALLTQVLGVGRIISGSKYRYYKKLDDSYGKYFQIMQLIEEDPIAGDVKTIDDEELKAIVASTGDPYAEYYTSDEYAEFTKRYAGDYVGIGVAVGQEGDDIVIERIFDDSPAQDAKLREKDIIWKVDGKVPADVDEAIELISGEAGTKLTLSIKRGDEVIEVDTVRAKIDLDSVAYSAYKEQPDVGYIAVTAFRKDTSDEFELAVRDLKAEGCDKFIIDLRDNGGGLTDESLKIADYLLPSCRIMSEVKKDGTEKVYNSKASAADLEMVVLVNENTASASEILTAAIQDNKAGTVIGTKTYGKGVTQITRQFKDGSAIKITSTEYYRPSGEKVNGVGITPDIEAEGEALAEEALKELNK